MLINEDCTVQVADFGLSRSLAGVQSQTMEKADDEMTLDPKGAKDI